MKRIYCVILTTFLVMSTGNAMDQALLSAVQAGDSNEVKRLLGAGANPDAKDPVTRKKHFDFALDNKDIGLVIELYKKGAKRTPLAEWGKDKELLDRYVHKAIFEGRVNDVSSTLELWPSYVPKLRDIFRRSLLHGAARRNDSTMIAMLCYHLDCDEPDREGRTVLMHALLQRSPVAEILISKTKDFFLKSNNRWTILFYAVFSYNFECFRKIFVKMREKQGNLDFLLEKDVEGKTVIDLLNQIIHPIVQQSADSDDESERSQSDSDSESFDDEWIGCAQTSNVNEIHRMIELILPNTAP